MEREFDREIYLNKEKYDAAVEEETKLKNELISKRVKDIKDGMDYNERQCVILETFLEWRSGLRLQRMMV